MGMKETSVITYNRLRDEGILSKNRWIIYDILFQNGQKTAGEIFNLGSVTGRNFRVKGSVCARLTEMERMGLVKSVGQRNCAFTQELATVWEVTGDMPVEVERGMTAKEKITFLKATAKNAAEALRKNGFADEATEIENNIALIDRG